MSDFKWTDPELKRYGELFQSCDVDGTGKFSWMQVADLFRSSGLSQEALQQITELCGAKRLGHFGRSQFYIALKLIAAVQYGLPPTQESLSSGIDIPLPAFNKVAQNDPDSRFQQQGGEGPGTNFDRQVGAVGHIPPPPMSAKKSHGRNLSGQFQDVITVAPVQIPNKEGIAPEAKSPPFSPGSPMQATPQSQVQPMGQSSGTLTPPTSPIATPLKPQYPVTNTAIPPTSPSSSMAPTFQSQQGMVGGMNNMTPVQVKIQAGPVGNGGGGYVNQAQETEWTNFDSDEKEGLIDSGVRKDWDNLKLPEVDSSSISSDPESIDDVFSINDEQREYYVRQFQSLEPDINGSIQGPVAKEFFVKSKLSNAELSKIWHLSDLNKDGALNLEEFCIAMHLVVLKRNDIDIPNKLPFALMPYNAFTNEEPFAADLPQGSTLKRQSPSTSPSAQTSQWEKVLLQESPQISSSEVSSPGGTPANFDFPKPEATDPEARILHPTPRRVSPDSQLEMPDGRVERGRAFSDPVAGAHETMHETENSHTPLTKQRSNTASHADHNHTETPVLQGRPRPSVKKHSVPSSLPGHILPPVPLSSQSQEAGDRPLFTSAISVDSGGQEPPVPPPRPGQHGRSFSVDYKGAPLSAPPAVPPRTSAKDVPGLKKGELNFAEFKKFQPIQSQEQLNLIADVEPPTVNGTDTDPFSQDYRKGTGAGLDTSTDYVSSVAVDPRAASDLQDFLGDDLSHMAQRQYNRDKKELQMAIRTHKERNSTLNRLNSELNQELQEVMEQRIALEIQLGHLRPFSS